MATPQRPRLSEIRDIYLLVGECRELGSDPAIWRQRMLRQLQEILGASVAYGGESVPPQGDGGPWRQWTLDVGWENSSDRVVYLDWSRENRPELNPINRGILARREPLPTYFRRQLVDDRAWYGGEFFEVIRAAHHDDTLESLFLDPAGHVHMVSLLRAPGDKPFGERQRRLLRLFQREIVPLVGGVLANYDEPSVSDLSPRLRQTLLCLLEGDSEKQVALRLGISRHTVHEYTKRLYRHLRTSTRGELIVRCARMQTHLQDADVARSRDVRLLVIDGDESSLCEAARTTQRGQHYGRVRSTAA